MAKSFFWYELMTTDVEAAEAFYTAVVGWTGQDFPASDRVGRYVVMHAGERGVGGLMKLPEEARKMGTPPIWLGYIHSVDVNRSVQDLTEAGGHVHRAPEEIPGVGHFAVVADPQGAVFMLLQPNGADQPKVPMTTNGHVGWHELFTSDWEKAFDFYAGRYGWTKGEPMDMGPMGTYQLFNVDGEPTGGMMNKPEQIPVPVWQFYFTVPAIDAAARRVTDNGGKVLMGPMDVPGGQWVVQCQDPQGAHFALVAAGR